MATLSFLPTPSVLETSTGSFHLCVARADGAPKPPMPPSTPGVKVRLAWWRILCFASSATAMFTPASAYFMRELFASVSDPLLIGAHRAVRRALIGIHWSAVEGRGGNGRQRR